MYENKLIPCIKLINGVAAGGPAFCGANDPVMRALAYERAGADGVIFLDASARGCGVPSDVVRRAALSLGLPVAVECAGGAESVREAQRAGASKVVLGGSAVRSPGLIREAAEIFGRDGVIVSVCAQRRGSGYWELCTENGTKPEYMDAYGWALTAEWLGAGELLLSSVTRGGAIKEADMDFTKLISSSVSIPVAVECGAPSRGELFAMLTAGGAASLVSDRLFGEDEGSLLSIKRYLSARGVSVKGAGPRLCPIDEEDFYELRKEA